MRLNPSAACGAATPASSLQRCGAVAQPRSRSIPGGGRRPSPLLGPLAVPLPLRLSPEDAPHEDTAREPLPCAPSTSGSAASRDDAPTWVGALAVLERSYSSGGLERAGAQAPLLPRVVQFPAHVEQKPPPGPPKQKRRNEDKKPDYFANVGDAIRALRDDIPRLFERELNYEIYRDDVLFKDPRNTFQGIDNYKLLFWSLRFHGRIFFSKLYVEVHRIWQPDDSEIKMRWTVRGIPRVPWEAEGTFDGISTYSLDASGRIYEHVVDNVLLQDPPMQANPLLAGLNLNPLAGGAARVPQLGAWSVQHDQLQAAPRCECSGEALSGSGAAACAPEAMGAVAGGALPAATFSWVRLYAVLCGTALLADMGALTHGRDAATTLAQPTLAADSP